MSIQIGHVEALCEKYRASSNDDHPFLFQVFDDKQDSHRNGFRVVVEGLTNSECVELRGFLRFNLPLDVWVRVERQTL